ncbi:hypothetical protein N7456_013375 [Penicillium angulare]|uniref:Uncharacterized protein n=1 Tax=Penicillium angulare TaxID=116970 RepID=A0A9W9JTW9_9EURO|nr:hypothetical protein N7456_013375 [Penicillium angulare]
MLRNEELPALDVGRDFRRWVQGPQIFPCSCICNTSDTTVDTLSHVALSSDVMVRTILITGCSDGGMEAALAKDFHRRADRVFATAQNISKMEPLGAIDIEVLSSMSYPKIQSKLPVPNACHSTFCSCNALE